MSKEKCIMFYSSVQLRAILRGYYDKTFFNHSVSQSCTEGCEYYLIRLYSLQFVLVV